MTREIWRGLTWLYILGQGYCVLELIRAPAEDKPFWLALADEYSKLSDSAIRRYGGSRYRLRAMIGNLRDQNARLEAQVKELGALR